jgi:hypothetical protein
MLDLACRRAEATGAADRCEFVLGTFPKDAPQETFDYAVVMGVLDYIADPAAFLGPLAQRVRGKAALSFPSQHGFRTPLRKLRYWLKRCPVYFYGSGQVQSLMEDAGFADVQVVKIPGAGQDYVAIGRGTAK